VTRARLYRARNIDASQPGLIEWSGCASTTRSRRHSRTSSHRRSRSCAARSAGWIRRSTARTPLVTLKVGRLDEKIGNLDARLTDKIESLDVRLTTGIDALRTEVVAELDIRERLATLEARRPA